jgi:superfamily II DNA or RNA helicase
VVDALDDEGPLVTWPTAMAARQERARPFALTLRDCQRRGLNAVDARRLAGAFAVLLNLPTGAGKTIAGLAYAIARYLVAAGGRPLRVVWLAHRRELVENPAAVLASLRPDLADAIGIVQAARDDCDAQIVFVSIQTVFNRRRRRALLRSGDIDLIVVDEAHHAASPAWRAVIEDLRGPDTFVLGLTATPTREDHHNLSELFDGGIVAPTSIDELIREGVLVAPVFVVERLPLDGEALRTRGGDYDEGELGDALIEAGIVDHAVEQVALHADGRHGVGFCATVEQAHLTADACNAAGIPSAVVSGDMSTADRAAVLEDLRVGRVRFVWNCAVLTEGWDDPAIDCVVLARPTRSKGLYVQCVGRGLRQYPGKADCLVLDLAGASEEHTLHVAPVLMDREHEPSDTDGTTRARRSLYAGLLDARARSPFRWPVVEGLAVPAWACTAGDVGTVVVFDHGVAGMEAVLFRRSRLRGAESLVRGAGPGVAFGLGEDVARQAERFASKDTTWLRLAPTASQLRALRLRGVQTVPTTRGEASDLLTVAHVTRSARAYLEATP